MNKIDYIHKDTRTLPDTITGEIRTTTRWQAPIIEEYEKEIDNLQQHCLNQKRVIKEKDKEIERLYSVISDDEENLKLLQEENERLKTRNKILAEDITKDRINCEVIQTVCGIPIEEILELKLYKSRNEKEIERLNNIINELEKWIKEDKEYAMNNFECGRCFNMFDIINKLKELKDK